MEEQYDTFSCFGGNNKQFSRTEYHSLTHSLITVPPKPSERIMINLEHRALPLRFETLSIQKNLENSVGCVVLTPETLCLFFLF